MVNNRLQKIIDIIPQNSIGIIDVGTDYGYLPIQLALDGFKGEIYASDLRQKPLNVAINNAQFYDVFHRIHFYIDNGLNQCNYNKIDTIIIAGMGGDLICDILDKAEWTMDQSYTMILQPMSKPEILRFWLCNNGYKIVNEYYVNDTGRDYTILLVVFTGENEHYSDAELFIGKNPSKSRIQAVIKELRKKPYSAFDNAILKELENYEST